jgi:predicted  nucleic acid-binding Zn-ribbon protein
MKKRTIRRLLKEVEQQKARIAADRDKLRDLHYELDEILSGCDEAVEALDRTADAMSQLL